MPTHSIQILAAFAKTDSGCLRAIPTMMRITPAAKRENVMMRFRIGLRYRLMFPGLSDGWF